MQEKLVTYEESSILTSSLPDHITEITEMKDLLSLPTSMRTRLERENELASQNTVVQRGDTRAPIVLSTTDEIAKRRPELSALVAAAHLGFHELSSIEHDTSITYRRVPHKFLGIEVGESWVPVQTQRITRKQWRLS